MYRCFLVEASLICILLCCLKIPLTDDNSWRLSFPDCILSLYLPDFHILSLPLNLSPVYPLLSPISYALSRMFRLLYPSTRSFAFAQIAESCCLSCLHLFYLLSRIFHGLMGHG